MLGYRSDESEAHVSSRERLVHPDDRADVLILLHAHFNGETPEYESDTACATRMATGAGKCRRHRPVFRLVGGLILRWPGA